MKHNCMAALCLLVVLAFPAEASCFLSRIKQCAVGVSSNSRAGHPGYALG